MPRGLKFSERRFEIIFIEFPERASIIEPSYDAKISEEIHVHILLLRVKGISSMEKKSYVS